MRLRFLGTSCFMLEQRLGCAKPFRIVVIVVCCLLRFICGLGFLLHALMVCLVYCVSWWCLRFMFCLSSGFVTRGLRNSLCDVTARCFKAGMSMLRIGLYYTRWSAAWSLLLLAGRNDLSKRGRSVSTSPPRGNTVDGLPRASKFRAII